MAHWGDDGVRGDYRDQVDDIEGDRFDAGEEANPSFRPNTDAEGMMRELAALGIRYDGGNI
jgi:hypothetical protein